MATYSAKIVYRAGTLRKKTGLAQASMRVSINSHQFFVSTHVHIEPHQWDSQSRHVNRQAPRHPAQKSRQYYPGDMNLLLDGALARANEIFTEYRLRGLELTKEVFLQEYHQPASREDFMAFMQRAIDAEVHRGKISNATEQKHRLTLSKLKRFRKTILFSHLSRRLILDFDAWHLDELKKTQGSRLVAEGSNTRINAIKHISKYLKQAQLDQIKFTWPIYEINLTQQFQDREFLTPPEIDQLIELYHDPGLRPAWRRILRYFLFGCFTGLALSDLSSLTWEENIYWSENRLQYIRNKTSRFRQTVNVPLSPVATQLLKDTCEKQPGKGDVFQVISEYQTSKSLKEIISHIGISKNISSHTARHSFAACFLILGGSLVALKKLMGHKKIETTMIYAHLTDKSIDDQVANTFGKRWDSEKK